MFGLSPETLAAAQREFLESGTGLFASNNLEAGAFYSCDPRSEFPDTQLFFVPSFGLDMADGGAPDRHGFSAGLYVNCPESRGEVRVISSNPLDRPLIDPEYLSAPDDLDLGISSLEVMRRIGDATAFAPVGAREVHPGKDATSRDALAAYARRTANHLAPNRHLQDGRR